MAVLPEGTPAPALKSVTAVVDLLSDTVHQCRTGTIDVRIANATGYLCSVLLRGLQDSDFDKRLAAIEAAQGQTNNGNR